MSQTLFVNGTILTMDETRGLYAEALLAEDGRIAAVGARSDVEAAAHAPEIVDLHGAALLPAFIDPHSHLSSVAMGLQQAAVEGARDYADLIERIQRYIRENNVPAGQWVTAHGYDHNALAEHRPPTREVLDKAAPENPLVLQHASGHTGVFNTQALQALGLDAATPDPDGGRFGRAADGALTGYAEENAFIETIKRIPTPGGAQLLDCYRRAQQLYASFGIATVQDGLIVDQMAPLYEALVQTGTLFLDTVGYADFRSCEALHTRLPAHWDGYRGRFRIGGYKTFLDGSPQARTAWLRQPYVPADGQPPAEPGEEDGFDGFPYGTPAEEIAAEADWRYWHLAQEGVPVGGLEATAVYRFDGDGKLRAGWYDFSGTDQAAVDAAWQAGLTWLEETYGLASGEDGDPTSLWTVGKVQVSLARTPDGVRLTVAGDGYPV